MAVSTAGCTAVMLSTLVKVMYLFCPAPNLLEYLVVEERGRISHGLHKQLTKPPRNRGIKVNGLPEEQSQVLTCTCSSALYRDVDQA